MNELFKYLGDEYLVLSVDLKLLNAKYHSSIVICNLYFKYIQNIDKARQLYPGRYLIVPCFNSIKSNIFGADSHNDSMGLYDNYKTIQLDLYA